MPVPLDEYPIHQAPLSLSYVASSDRNFYDRCYFNAHDRTGDVMLITGMGYYTNLGVMDAYACVRRGDKQYAVRFSDAISDDRLNQRVGGYRVEVIEPLQKIRLVCEGRREISFDLTWDGSSPAIQEHPHVMRQGVRPILDASRFAQVGSWSGILNVGGEELTVDPEVWMGTRDRSWGIRPVGESEPPGRSADEPNEGFWWLYVPLRFEDYVTIVLAQERPDGFRTHNDAVRLWRDGRIEQLGWPEVDVTYRSGSRHPEHATLRVRDGNGKPLTIEVDTLGFVALHIGAGYGGDPDWSHGRWMGRGWSDGAVYDLTDPQIAGRIPFGVIDHVARGNCEGAEGWGLFEHASVGRHDPSGFADWGSVAQ
jgi:hypothetical protein